jgi:hypothetical protein
MKVLRKVTKKLGRRKHSRNSSISCRRLRSKKSYKKNSYRKKNAKSQKGGKRGRSYKCMRVHTHKRGKRFHRGGVGKWNDDSWKNDVASGLLVYQKDIIRSVTSETKSFDVTLEKTSNLIEIPPRGLYGQGENFIRFKVTMKRYKDGDTGDYDKTFTIYFAFGYVPPTQNVVISNGGMMDMFSRSANEIEWFLFQTTESEVPIEQTLLYWDNKTYGFQPRKRIRMPAKVDTHHNYAFANTNTDKVSIHLPEKFKGIIGDYISKKSEPEKYIFWGEKMDFTNWVDASRSNVDFFNSLATQMYRIVRKTAYDAAKAAAATPPSLTSLTSAEHATPPSLTSLASTEPDAASDAAPLADSEVSETLPPAGSNVAAEGSDDNPTMLPRSLQNENP